MGSEKKSFKGKSLRTHARRTIRHDISSTGFQPVELKMKEFMRGHSEDASYDVSIKLTKWLGRISCLKENVNTRTDARTTDNSP